MPTEIIFGAVVLIFSVILHEVAHGYMANYLGDPTARLQGRLTLNPISHIDPMGTIFVPLVLVLFNSPMLIGWAKPVPYNPYNIKNKYGDALVAAAGPGTNILLALIFGLAIRFFGASFDSNLFSAFATITYINLVLALFNLIPLPPLDGSKVLSSILPGELGRMYTYVRINFEHLGMLTVMLIVLVVFHFISPFFTALLMGAFTLITGTGM